jgi:LysM repeat protein
MTQRSKAPARALAVIALLGAFVILAVLIAGSVGGGDSGVTRSKSSNGNATREGGGQKKAPASYVVQNGDTLTSIAHQTGVSVARIQQLNPEVDPQILISGEKLKLR